ncbi:hypothetical protein NDR87_09875 [Nocardia sp. CDC159]|uniref:Nitrile hydratase alpha /Thiocyanate hydrolase gamma domain-containing protein n=1 Tax=Nocardia pulmonis TaxID=2951408 RepID=A0A9X2E8P4_9NOCA|nr:MULTISPECIES: hypothetical protein [Nocardia]MCM6773776.1 hypothetical protein [Nocardia pulmonis]MCM6786663.1 hypothetical protein [Nocardia sp. CDC159]
MTHDYITAYYTRLMVDPDYRRELLADPTAAITEEYGCRPDGVRIEAVEQREDTVVILLPAPPEPGADLEHRLNATTRHSLDLLFASGLGGFFIPDDQLMWTLRDMRTAWIAKNESSERSTPR